MKELTLRKKAGKGTSRLYSSALWEIKEQPGVLIYRSPGVGWVVEIGEEATGRCPQWLNQLIAKQASSILYLGEHTQTRRNLLDKLEVQREAEKKTPGILSQLL